MRTPHRRRAPGLVATFACAFVLAFGEAGSTFAAEAPVLRVATSGDYAPFSISKPPSADVATPADAAPLSGFDIAVAQRFAADRGYRIEFLRFRWPDLGRELAASNFDVAMSGVTMRAERSIAGRFSVPVAATRAIALTWKGSGAASIEDLDRAPRRIAVNAGGHLEAVARRVFRRAEVVAIPDNEAVRMGLLDRAYDAVVTDDFEEKAWTDGVKDIVRIGPLSDDRKAYLLPAGREQLASELDRWLLANEKNGTLAGLRARHFDDVAAVATATPLEALAAAIAERMAIMPNVYEAKRQARKAIEDKDQEAAVLDAALAATREAAATAGTTAPDATQTRLLFKALIEMGRQVQQRLADDESARRLATVRERVETRRAARAAAEAAGTPTGQFETDPVKDDESDLFVAEPRGPRYDLATELRPAIARITGKIARILVAFDQPVSSGDAKRRFAAALSGQNINSGQLDVLAETVENISERGALR